MENSRSLRKSRENNEAAGDVFRNDSLAAELKKAGIVSPSTKKQLEIVDGRMVFDSPYDCGSGV